MDERFLGLERLDDTTWGLPVTDSLTGGRNQLFGGCVVGAAGRIVEMLAGQPAVWATAQFYEMVTPGRRLDATAIVVARGRSLTQARVHFHADGRETMCVLVAAGSKSYDGAVQTGSMPEVPPPEACGPRLDELTGQGGISARLDARPADPTRRPWASGTAHQRTALWMRFDGLRAGDLISTAIVADYFPPVLGAALGAEVFGSSLDNTMRWLDRADEDWLLVDATVDTVRNGIATAYTRVWTVDGRLLAIGSQSCGVSRR